MKSDFAFSTADIFSGWSITWAYALIIFNQLNNLSLNRRNMCLGSNSSNFLFKRDLTTLVLFLIASEV